MATRQSPSRESSVSRISTTSSRPSNPDVFSDEFAVPSRGNSPDASPVDSKQSSLDNLTDHVSSPTPQSPRVPCTTRSHLNTINFSRPSSTSKRPQNLEEGHNLAPHRTVSQLSHSDEATHRSSSISSHFSMPRSLSPYVGPTAPSQPYAMYPQVTRASSITSESTIRPTERPYVGITGPEHAYGMYPQNGVAEEDGSNAPSSIIPLGFPGLGRIYDASAQTSEHDVADIVGSDGHVEQLPPYTRYADNIIAKGVSHDATVPVAPTTMEIPLSPISQHSDTEVELNTGAARDAGEPGSEYSEKSTRQRLRRKVCFGVSLCVWLLVAAVVIIAGTLGGVIGGVIGNDRASDAAADAASPTATTTVWLDANPLPTNSPAPECIEGSFNIPTDNISVSTSACVADQSISFTWGCEFDDAIPFNIEYGPNQQAFIQLGAPYPGRSGMSFNYGPQVPDLNGTHQPLQGKTDKDDPNAGPAMFFWTYYNKLTIVPQTIFEASQSKRSIDISELEERAGNGQLTIYETPYFCWFNDTVLEFFIYSEVNTSAAAASSTSYVYPFSNPTTTASQTTAAAAATTAAPHYNTSPDASLPSSIYYNPSWTTGLPSRRMERDSSSEENDPIYPQQIRLTEKRKPGPNIQPFCVKMKIEEDWSVCPIGPSININEVEPPTSSPQSRRWEKRQSSTNVLDSDCACQWYST